MAKDLMQVTFTGRLAADPEMKFVGSSGDIALTKFRVAVNVGFGDKAYTEWMNCEAWRQTAEFLAEYAHKGSSIAIQVKLKTDEYEKDGQKQRWVKITVDEAVLLDPKGDDTGERPARSAAPQAAAPARQTEPAVADW